MRYSGEKHRFNYLERTGFLDAALILIEQKFSIVCNRVKKTDRCPVLNLTSDEKSRFLRRAVYETLYEGLARNMYPWKEPINYVTPNPNANLETVLRALEGPDELPETFGKDVKQRSIDYFYYVADQVRNFKCEKEDVPKMSASDLQASASKLDREEMTKYYNILKGLSLNALVTKAARGQGSWEENFKSIMQLAGQWEGAKKCGQAKEFFDRGYAWILLSKAFGLFNLTVRGEDFVLESFANEPTLKDYNQFHAKYVYSLMQRRFPFLSLPITDKWYGNSFLDLRELKFSASVNENQWKTTKGLELIQRALSHAWTNFASGSQEDLLNFYSNISFSQKHDVSSFKTDQRFEKLFDHYQDFRFQFTAYHAVKENISVYQKNAEGFLASPEKFKEWMDESADEKIKDAYHPLINAWEKVKSFLFPVIMVSMVISIFGWILGGVEFLGATLLSILLTADTVGLAIIMSDSAYNIIYKNNIELPSTIAAQTKVATAYSFYSPKTLPLSASSWSVNLDQAATSVEDRYRKPEKLSDQIWSQGLKSQDANKVLQAKSDLKSKKIWDGVDLGLNIVLFYLPVAPQIRKNFLILKQGRTLEKVMKAAGLPYMNFPQRVNYFFGKAPEVQELIAHLQGRPLQSFFKKTFLAIDPKSQVIALSKTGFKNLEEQFFLNLIHKDYKARESIALLYKDASKRSLNPKIDLLHEELDLYVNFMKSVVNRMGKLSPEKLAELSTLLKSADYAEHATLVYNRVREWTAKGKDLDKALADEAKMLTEMFGNLPMKQGDVIGDMTRISLLHANGGDLLALKMVGVGPETEAAAKLAFESFANVEKVMNYYRDILNLSKYQWHDVSTKYLQNKLKNTLKLEENLFMGIKNSKQIVVHGSAPAPQGNFVEQLSMTEKLAMEQELAKAWTFEMVSASEGTQLGLMMMLRDFQGLHASLTKSPKLMSFFKENMGDMVSVQNFFSYVNGRAEAPLYAQLLSNWSKSGNVVQKMNDKLEKLENGAGFFHYVEVPMASENFRVYGLLK